MTISRRGESAILLLGDVAALALSLLLAFPVRYGYVPSWAEYSGYLLPFSFLFAVSVLIYFVAGLYDKHTLVLVERVPNTLVKSAIAIAVVAVTFFYLVPFFDITPKTFLFVYLVLSLVLTALWRVGYLRLFKSNKRQPALLVGTGAEADDLCQEVNGNGRYGISFVEHVRSADASIVGLIQSRQIGFVAADLNDPAVRAVLPSLYSAFFQGVEFVDMRDLYEEIFDRVPLSLIDDAWCLSNLSGARKPIFDLMKRSLDAAVSGILGVASLLVYPFVLAAIKLDDGGVFFSYQTRIGQRGVPIRVAKFRTMSVANDDGKWGSQRNSVTRVGRFLRKSRIDELPQLWNVLRGDISLIGPRPEFPEPVALYSKEIPFYGLRHIVKPGLSGWAQIYHEKHPHHGIDTNETSNKLSYDLYYIQNRSFFLDLKIALRTMKVLLSFAGR